MVEAISQLPEKYRLPVILRHFAGCSYEDISAMTGLSKTAIDTRLRTAKKKLKKTLIEMNRGVDQ